MYPTDKDLSCLPVFYHRLLHSWCISAWVTSVSALSSKMTTIPKVRQPGCRRRFARWQRTVGSSLSGNRVGNAHEKWQPLSTIDLWKLSISAMDQDMRWAPVVGYVSALTQCTWPIWLSKFTRNDGIMGWRWMELSWLSSLKAKTRSIRQVVACFLMKSWDFCTTCHGGAWTCAWEIASQSQFVYVSRSSVRERGRWGGGEGLSDDQRANLVLNF